MTRSGASGGRLAIVPGSFDPLTNGHVDIVLRSARLFDRVTVAVLVNAEKTPMFDVGERVSMIQEVFVAHANIAVESFEGLLVDYARRRGADVVVRGMRTVADFEQEFQMTLMNRHLDSALETVFMVPDPQCTFVSSRLTKEVFRLGGSVQGLVPPAVERRMRTKHVTVAHR